MACWECLGSEKGLRPAPAASGWVGWVVSLGGGGGGAGGGTLAGPSSVTGR